MSQYVPVITNKGDLGYDYPDLYVGNRRVGSFYALGQGAQDLLDEILAKLIRKALEDHGINFDAEEEDEDW